MRGNKSKFKRILALLLSLITLMTAMQMIVFADEGTTDEVGNAKCEEHEHQYYGEFPLNTFMITYNLNGGINDPIALKGYVCGIGAVLPVHPTREGYTFAGWYDNAELTGKRIYTICPFDCGNKEFWAKWTANEYLITYNMNGGTNEAGAPTGYVFGVGATLPTAPTKEGHTFLGWYDNAELTGTAVTAIGPTEKCDKVFWASWDCNDYTITYNLNGGTNEAGAPTGYDFGVGATLPTAPTKEGFTFLGWYDNAELTGTAVTAVGPTETGNKVFWASWDANDYTITYNLDGGTNEVGAPTGYVFGVGATLPTAPTKAGHTFLGWYDNAELTGTAVTAIGPTETGDKVFWASWDANDYTITYNLDGGTNEVGAPTGYTVGVGATLPTAPTKAGHTFLGWYDNAELTGTAVTAVGPTETGNKVFWASWDANDYTITYNLNGGTNPVGAPTGYTFGVGATLPVPTYDGYTFKGWYDNAELTGTAITAISATDTGNMIFWAKWEKNSTEPATGDNIPTALLTAVAVISGTSLVVLLKKKKKVI